MASFVQRALMQITGLPELIRKEVALKAQIGGIQSQFSGGDDLVGDIALIEETLSQFNVITRMHRDRKLRYRDYDAMDNYGDISVALDIYAEEATSTDLIRGTNLWVSGNDQESINEIENLIQKLRIRTLIHGFARQVAKYGDLFISPRYNNTGVARLYYIPPGAVERIGPGIDSIKHFKLENQLAQLSPRKDGILLPWECVHFRLLSFGFSTLYGRSMIEASRKRWLHLKLIEDAVAIYRLNRSVERLIYYIDVGQASPMEALSIVQQYKKRFGNKRSYLNPDAASFETQYDPTNMMENIFWPVNSATERSRIDKLTPPPDQNQLQDLDHFNQKLFVSLGIPKDYLTGDVSGAWNSREALSLQDVRFSRKIHNLQVSNVEGLERLFRFHLAVIYGDAVRAKEADFKVELADVSQVARQQYDQILLNRVQLLSTLNQLGIEMQFNRETWSNYIMTVFFPDIPRQLLKQIIIPDDMLANQATINQQAAMAQQSASASKPQKKQQKEELRSSLLASITEAKRVKAEGVLTALDTLMEDMPSMNAGLLQANPAPTIPLRWLQEAVKQFSKK